MGPRRLGAGILAGALAAAVLWLLLVPTTAVAQEESEVVVFWAEGCPYCEAELAFLDELAADYPDVVITTYEVRNDVANRQLFAATMVAHGVEPSGVPTTIIGDQIWVGFDAERGEAIRSAVAALAATGTDDPVDAKQTIDVPLVGSVEVTSDSLLLSTLIIGLVDGFNPCSLWVLSILLALVLYSGSRKRVLGVGLVFLLVTTALYAVYILGLYSVLSYISYVDWIRIGVAAVALVFGLLNAKDYFAFKRGPSLTIADERKPALYRKMRIVAAPDRPLLPVIGGTAMLAVGVSLIETPCTAGFPVLWADLVAEAEVGWTTAGLLFGVYMAVFLADELLVLATAVVALRTTKLTETHGRVLKLISGIVMITLAGVLIIAPDLMESVAGAVGVFAIATTATLILILLDRTLGLTAPGRHRDGHATR
jgi:cytochrome c biogenesis protein CcdA/thiol-disulfide isomerase/thioredoxin